MLKTLIRTAASVALLAAAAIGPVQAQEAAGGAAPPERAADTAGDAQAEPPSIGGAPIDPSKTITDNMAKASNLTTLLAAVKEADLAEALSGEGPFTIFAPDNAAFQKLPEGTVDDLLKAENKDRLATILTYHILPAEVMSQDALSMVEEGGGQHEAKTVEGEAITLSSRDGNLVIRDAQGNEATVTQADVRQSNGIVHVIDTVLMPSE